VEVGAMIGGSNALSGGRQTRSVNATRNVTSAPPDSVHVSCGCAVIAFPGSLRNRAPIAPRSGSGSGSTWSSVSSADSRSSGLDGSPRIVIPRRGVLVHRRHFVYWSVGSIPERSLVRWKHGNPRDYGHMAICLPRASLDATTRAIRLRSRKCDGDMPRRDTMGTRLPVR
jgi:hypothetical protein